MLFAWLGLLLATHARPPCTESNLGRFWPEEANNNPKFAAALMPYGYPEICTFDKGSYRWRSFAVSVRQLRKKPPAKTPPSRRTEAGAGQVD